MKRLTQIALIAFCFASRAIALEPPSYIAEKDESYKWTHKKTFEVPGAKVAIIRLTSQTWQGMKWRHWVFVIRPDEVKHPGHALLAVGGGVNSKKTPTGLSPEAQLLKDVAVRTGSVMVIVGQVPNQPLFENKYEDVLIAHTFQQYLETKDESWPALMPMTKAAIRAMDCATEYLKETFQQELRSWVVTGASKRGWTTWLAAAFDPRVVAIAPMVIDTLNFPRQMELQRKSFGSFSEQISEYTDLKLQERSSTPEGKRLVEIVDPYAYRERFTMPKLIVLGTNDRYWPVDAVKEYFRDLPGETFIHYVPNAGHGLGPGVLEVTGAFYMSILENKPRPKFEWTCATENGECVVTVKATDLPLAVEFWSAESSDRDFRDDEWAGAALEGKEGVWVGKLKVKEAGFCACHVRLKYKGALGDEYWLCTNVEVCGAGK